MTTPNPESGQVRKAILRAFDAPSYTAAIQVTGTVAGYLYSIPVARDIAAAELLAGRYVALAVFDPTNTSDTAVIAVWT